MKYKQYRVLCEYLKQEDDAEHDFPAEASQRFWEYALYHARMMAITGARNGYGSMSHFIVHLEEELDDYLKEGEPIEWLFWLFDQEGVSTPPHLGFHLVYEFDNGHIAVNWERGNHEFLVQPSDEFKNQFEVLDLHEGYTQLYVADTYEEANQWLDEQLALYVEHSE